MWGDDNDWPDCTINTSPNINICNYNGGSIQVPCPDNNIISVGLPGMQGPASPASGNFYSNNNPSGFITGINTGNFISTSQTGQFYPINNPSGYITGINTGNFITTSQTGIFYLITNPSGFITGLNTGNFISTNQTGQFASTSNLYSTGNNLLTNINALSGYINNSHISNIVYITGSQIINGNKEFNGGIEVDTIVSPTSSSIVNLGSQILNDGNSHNAASLDWTNRYLLDMGENSSVEWDNRLLYDVSANISFDYNNRILSGNWKTQNIFINGFISGIGGNARYVSTSGWQIFNFTTNLWHTLLCVGNPPTIAFDSGSH